MFTHASNSFELLATCNHLLAAKNLSHDEEEKFPFASKSYDVIIAVVGIRKPRISTFRRGRLGARTVKPWSHKESCERPARVLSCE